MIIIIIIIRGEMEIHSHLTPSPPHYCAAPHAARVKQDEN
jgi:hypothetical protein